MNTPPRVHGGCLSGAYPFFFWPGTVCRLWPVLSVPPRRLPFREIPEHQQREGHCSPPPPFPPGGRAPPLLRQAQAAPPLLPDGQHLLPQAQGGDLRAHRAGVGPAAPPQPAVCGVLAGVHESVPLLLFAGFCWTLWVSSIWSSPSPDHQNSHLVVEDRCSKLFKC